jgi:hypothetical protein
MYSIDQDRQPEVGRGEAQEVDVDYTMCLLCISTPQQHEFAASYLVQNLLLQHLNRQFYHFFTITRKNFPRKMAKFS